jgi:hypothetical protein
MLIRRIGQFIHGQRLYQPSPQVAERQLQLRAKRWSRLDCVFLLHFHEQGYTRPSEPGSLRLANRREAPRMQVPAGAGDFVHELLQVEHVDGDVMQPRPAG